MPCIMADSDLNDSFTGDETRFSVKKELKAGLRRFGHIGLIVFALLFRIFVDQE